MSQEIIATETVTSEIGASEMATLPEELPPSMTGLVRQSPADVFAAFARFLQVDIANGDATADTIKAYHREVKYFVAWCVEYGGAGQGIDPVVVRREHIEEYREWLKTKGILPATRQHKLSIISRFYDAAVKHNLLKANPAAGVKGGKDLTSEVEKIKALTEGALTALAAAIPADTLSGKRDWAIVALVAIHGLRRVEIVRLDRASVELEGDAPRLRVEGKGSHVRRVYLRPDTLAAVTAYLAAKGAAGLRI